MDNAKIIITVPAQYPAIQVIIIIIIIDSQLKYNIQQATVKLYQRLLQEESKIKLLKMFKKRKMSNLCAYRCLEIYVIYIKMLHLSRETVVHGTIKIIAC